MEALLDLRESNPQPLSDLFQTCKPELDTFFKELNLCNKEDPVLEDLVKEFSAYETNVKEPIIKVELLELAIDAVEETELKHDSGSDAGSEDMDFKHNIIYEDNSESDNEWDSYEEKPLVEPIKKKRVVGNTEKKKKHNTSLSTENTGKKKRGRPRIHPEGSFLKEPWCCDKCKFKTKYRMAVERHKAVHVRRENRTYTCSECAEVFKSYEEMRSHSMNHPENQVVCEVCGMSLKNAYSLKAHMERHEDSRKYCCEYCDYASNTKLALKAHMSIHTKNGWNKNCDVCGVVFRT